MAKKADLLAQGKMKAEGASAQEEDAKQATDSTGVVPNTSQGVAIAEGKADLLTHAYPGTEAWKILEEGMNGDAVSVTAKTDMLDHLGNMRLRGETFDAPSRFAHDWKAKSMVSVNEGSEDAEQEEAETAAGGEKTATTTTTAGGASTATTAANAGAK